jgi:hypothetical protein
MIINVRSFLGVNCTQRTYSKHGPHDNRLHNGNGSVGITHLRMRDHSTLDNHGGLCSEVGWCPETQVRQFANFYTSNNVAHTLRNSRIDRILTDVPLHTKIVGSSIFIFFQRPTLTSVLVCSILSPEDYFTILAYRLRIRRHYTDSTDVMKNVFCGNSLLTDLRVGKFYILVNFL